MDPILPIDYQNLRNAIAQRRYAEARRLSEEFNLMGNLLQHSVYEKDLELAKWALDQGIDVHSYYHGLTPFMRACQDGEEDLARTILLHDLSQVNERTKGYGIWPNRTALMFASGAGNLRIADLLLSYGAEINAQDDLGFTSLMAAAEGGHDGMIGFLHSRGGDVSCIDETGKRALSYAVESGNTNAVALLLSYGMDINEPKPRDLSIPLWIAISRSNTEMLEFLLSHGADPSWRSSFGEDASGYAERAGSPPRIRELLREHKYRE